MVETEKRLARVLASILDGAVVQPGTSHKDNVTDMVVRLPDGSSIAIEAKSAGEGWPDDVRRAAAGVSDPWPTGLVLVARHLSPGAIEWLRERDANWADESGQARILGPGGLLVIREPAAPRSPTVARRGFAWSPSARSIAEVILARPDEPLRAARLADTSDWSTARVATVMQAFDAQGWTAKRGPARGSGAYRELVDPDAMLAAWSGSVAEETRDVRIAHRATDDVMSLLRGQLKKALDARLGWALSGWAGLEVAAPFATTIPSAHVYIADEAFDGPLRAAIADAGLREVDEGGRVTFWRGDHRILALAQQRGGVPVVSAPRLYADLSAFGARGQDAADHVKRELIDPLHREPPEWE